MNYTQREILIIYELLEKNDSRQDKQIMEKKIIPKLPWRKYESLKNFWKTGKKQSLDQLFTKYS